MILQGAFEAAGLPCFNPHSFRNTLVQFGQALCRDAEQFKAWSQNMGHDGVLTTFLSYGAGAPRRQGQIIPSLGLPGGNAAKQDYGYVRKGATKLFVAVESEAGQRVVCVTEHRGKTDFVGFIQSLLTDSYAAARRVHTVLDNLNTHFRKSFDEVLGKRAAGTSLRRVTFHQVSHRHRPKRHTKRERIRCMWLGCWSASRWELAHNGVGADSATKAQSRVLFPRISHLLASRC